MPGQRTFYFLRLLGAADGGTLPVAEYIAQLREPSRSRHAFERPDGGIGFFEHLAKSPDLEAVYAHYMTFFSEKVMPDIFPNIELPDEGLVADEPWAADEDTTCSRPSRRPPHLMGSCLS